MKPKLILAAEIVVLLGVVYLIVDLQRASQEEVLAQFRDHQSLVARQLAGQIESYLRARSRGLHVLASFASVQYQDRTQMAIDVEAYFDRLKSMHINAILVYDATGRVVYSTRADTGRLTSLVGLQDWAMKRENKGKVFIASLPRREVAPAKGRTSSQILLATPVYQETAEALYPKPTNKFAGVLAVAIDLEKLLAEQLGPANLNVSLNRVWVMQDDGALLFLPEHPLKLDSIQQRDDRCNQCHGSFAYTDRMLHERKGTVEYRHTEGAQKLAAFAPVEFETTSWIVVVNAPLDEVTAFVRKQFAETLLLLGLVVLALAGGSMLLYRTHRLKMRAEEETRQWKEKRALEDRIRESEERYRRLVERSPDAIAVHSEGTIVFINDAGAKLLGASNAEQLIGTPIQKIVHPDYWHVVQERIRAITDLGQEAPLVEEKFVRLDGTIIDVEVAAIPFTYQGKQAVQVVVRDITGRKRAEEASRRAAEEVKQWRDRYEAIVAATHEVVYEWDLERNTTQWGGSLEQVLGYRHEEFTHPSVHWRSLIHPEDRGRVLSAVEEALRNHSSLTLEYRFQHKDGTFLHLLDQSFIVRDAAGKAIRSLGSLTDITERKRAEEERDKLLRELQEAQASVKILSGLLPICSSCKKIRDEQGEWQVLERYLHSHTEATLTHGLCPECAQKLYPGFFAR